MQDVGKFPERTKLSDLTKSELIDIIKQKSNKNRKLSDIIKQKEARISELQQSIESLAKKYSDLTNLVVRK